MIISRLSLVPFAYAGLAALLATGVSPALAGQAHKTKLSASQAEAAALRKYKSGKIHGKTELENEGGKWEYAVMVHAGSKMHEVMVNANSGKIDSEEVVTAKEESAEKKAEAAAKKHPARKGSKPAEAPEKGEKGGKG